MRESSFVFVFAFSLLNIYIFWNGWSTSQYLDLPFKPCIVFPFINLDVNQFLYIKIRDCSQYSEESLALYQSINQSTGANLGEGGRRCPPLS